MSARISRSVGELLLEADAATRTLLFDVTGDDAPAMLRTWGEVVQSAAELWEALPALPGDQAARGQRMDQLQAISHGMHRTHLRQGWPGEGPSDERLLRVAESFSAARGLVARHTSPGSPPRSAESVRDVEAARTRTMHALYVGAHAVGVAVREHVRALQETPGIDKAWAGASRGIPRGQESLQRLTAFEQLASSYLGVGLPASLSGERQEGYAGLARFSDAMARWDLQAHRTLAVAATPANLAAIARSQAMVNRACLVLLRAAAHTGAADPTTFEHRTGPALEASMRTASHVASQWGSLTTAQTRRVDPQLWSADAELQAATRELIHDKTVLADPTLIAQRADLRDAAPAVAVAAAAGVELACAARGATNDTSLAAPAQAMIKLARQEMAAPGPGDLDDLGESVSAGDLHHNRLIPLIAPVREVLARSSAENIERAADASSAVSAHWRPRSPADTEPEAPLSRHAVHVPSPAASLCGPVIS